MSLAITAISVTAVGVGMDIVGGIAQKDAADNAAAATNATAQWNAQSDRAQAKQDDLNTLQALDNQRQQDKVVLSQYAGYYAGAGVEDTGSALHAQAEEAGLLEQQIQQQYTNSLTAQENLYANANVGIAEGQAQADAYEEQGDLALFNAGAKAVTAAGTGLIDAGAAGLFKSSTPMLDGVPMSWAG